MEVFDAITQHPVFSKMIKHLVYDSAQFVRLSFDQYCQALENQVDQLTNLPDLDPQYHAYRPPHVRDIIDTVYTVHKPLFQTSDERLMEDSRFVDGYRQYMAYAKEQRNLLRKFWFSRALRGLASLGDIQSVAVSNTWDKFLVPNFDCSTMEMDTPNLRYRESCEDEEYLETRSPLSGYDGDSVEGGSCEDDEDNDDRNRDAGEEDNRDDDTVVGGENMILEGIGKSKVHVRSGEHQGSSPIARTWPAVYLLPLSRIGAWYRPSVKLLRKGGISDGCFEILKVIQLLESAKKQPLEFKVPEKWWYRKVAVGAPQIIFDTDKWPESARFDAICEKLEVLDIRLTRCYNSYGYPRLTGLQSLFHEESALRELSVILPDLGEVDDVNHLYNNFSQIAPPVTQWHLPHLTKHVLQYMDIYFHELAGLLFINLPELKYLSLAYILLHEGDWEGVIEGLRRLKTLAWCRLEHDLLYLDERGEMDCVTYDENKHDYYGFLLALSVYSEGGDRHPSLLDSEPDQASTRFMMKLNRIIQSLRASHKSAATRGRDSLDRPRGSPKYEKRMPVTV